MKSKLPAQKPYRKPLPSLLNLSFSGKITPPTYFKGEKVLFKLSPSHELIFKNLESCFSKSLRANWNEGVVLSCSKDLLLSKPAETLQLLWKDENGFPCFIYLTLSAHYTPMMGRKGGQVMRKVTKEAKALRTSLRSKWNEEVERILEGPAFLESLRSLIRISVPVTEVSTDSNVLATSKVGESK